MHSTNQLSHLEWKADVFSVALVFFIDQWLKKSPKSQGTVPAWDKILCSLIKNEKTITTLEPIPKVHFLSNQLKNKMIMQVIMYHIQENLRNTGKCVTVNVLMQFKKDAGLLYWTSLSWKLWWLYSTVS